MPKHKLEPCPICGKEKRNLKLHTQIEHPSIVPPINGQSQKRKKIIPSTAKKIRNISWWKVVLGGACVCVGVLGMVLYAGSLNMLLGMVAVIGLVPGAFLLWFGFNNNKESGYRFDEDKYTGTENSIVIYADRNPENGLDIPRRIAFATIDPPLPGARPHLLRNLGKHFFEYYNVTGEKNADGTDKLKPAMLPDRKINSPSSFVIPSFMQPVKDAMEYNPPTNIQKVASGILILVIVIIGVLMTMTAGNPQAAAGG